MQATKLYEFSNGGIVAKLGVNNVYMISVDADSYAYWTLPPWNVPEAIAKSEVEWTSQT